MAEVQEARRATEDPEGEEEEGHGVSESASDSDDGSDQTALDGSVQEGQRLPHQVSGDIRWDGRRVRAHHHL